MIHYHGGPVTPVTAAKKLWTGRHAMVSFYNPEQISIAAEVCQSFALDNGAYSAWKAGKPSDWTGYYEWVRLWGKHPGCDFAIIPDSVEGSEEENDCLITQWLEQEDLLHLGVPVWHLHESLARLEELVSTWPRIAFGSSGEFSDPGSRRWWDQMGLAMNAATDEEGVPFCKFHGLRMLDPTLFSHLPLASADSTNVARNIGIDSRWDNSPYAPSSKEVRALVIADRIEAHASAPRWRGTYGTQMNLELFG